MGDMQKQFGHIGGILLQFSHQNEPTSRRSFLSTDQQANHQINRPRQRGQLQGLPWPSWNFPTNFMSEAGVAQYNQLYCMAEVEIKDQIRANLPLWKDLSNQDILLERMTGLTNQTYKASAKDQPPIIFRKFGESSQNPFLQRQSEIFVYMHVADEGLGPKVHHYDEQIRLEEFIESTVLPSSMMLSPGYLEEVAFALSKFHQLKPTSDKIKKESLFRRCFVDGVDSILNLCHQKMGKDIFLPEEQPILTLLKQWVSKQEVQFIDQLTKKYEEDTLVFSHNDLLANNILIQKGTNHFVFIDYEYACYNYPIYDIANYLVESQVNYDVNQPPFFEITPITPQDKDKQLRFIEAYVVAKDLTHEEFKANFESLRKEEKYQAEIKKLVEQLSVGMLLSNLMWGWWSIIVCKNPQISFDYIAFAKWRVQEYYKYKKLVTL